MKVASVILARGGSKEIPMKNIMDLNGHPLIYYAIKASQQSDTQETWVSTNSKRIAKVADMLGANVLMRPEELATDISPSEDALLHFANTIEFDVLVFIQPTSPLLERHYINTGLSKMENYDSVFSAYEEKGCIRWGKGESRIWPIDRTIHERPMRQEGSIALVENGAFYITTKEALLRSKNRYSGRIGTIIMPYSSSFQLDSLDDFSIIEAIMRSK